MNSSAADNVLIFQSGGCTPVMNRSLAGLMEELLEHRQFGQIYGAVHGLTGILAEEFLDLRSQPKGIWPRVSRTPGAVLGTGRQSLKPADVASVLRVLTQHKIQFLFTIGGNDSAETAHGIAQETAGTRNPVTVVHIPKTIDNDLMHTDHCPGYGSTARFIALATMGAGADAESMGNASPITVIEVMGRDAGWLAAAAALGKRSTMDPPHHVCIPEFPVDEKHFLDRMESAYHQWGYAVAVTAENVRGPDGPLGSDQAPILVDDFGHKYYRSPGEHLAQLLAGKLGVRVRSEKPGTIQRSMANCVSRTDAEEAAQAGRAAARYAIEGIHDVMVTLVRQPGSEYACTTGSAPLIEVAGAVRPMPSSFFDQEAALPTKEFTEYARPLIGGPLPSFPRLRNKNISGGNR